MIKKILILAIAITLSATIVNACSTHKDKSLNTNKEKIVKETNKTSELSTNNEQKQEKVKKEQKKNFKNGEGLPKHLPKHPEKMMF